MASVFRQVFGCCLQQRKSSRMHDPDECSRLIPATVEPSSISSPDLQVAERQRLKERLGSIVRSKEGKMVNVTSRLPFNLHNRTFNDPSSSRSASHSASASTLARPSIRSSPLSSTPHIQAYIGAPLINPTSPHADDSRSSSEASRDTSGTDSESAAAAAQRMCTLDIRLVRAIPITCASGGGSRSSAKRGRALKKAIASDKDSEGLGAALTLDLNHNGKKHDGGLLPHPDPKHDNKNANEETLHPPALSSPENTVVAQTPRDNSIYHIPSPSSSPRSLHSSSESSESSLDDTQKPMLGISPPSTIEFTLKDPGPLSVSWGD